MYDRAGDIWRSSTGKTLSDYITEMQKTDEPVKLIAEFLNENGFDRLAILFEIRMVDVMAKCKGKKKR